MGMFFIALGGVLTLVWVGFLAYLAASLFF
jgi:hypothetical protein